MGWEAEGGRSGHKIGAKEQRIKGAEGNIRSPLYCPFATPTFSLCFSAPLIL
jgi:hypothetical protein